MKLSEGVEWGIHCATLLAVLPPGSVLGGAALAEFHGVSESYLLKHLHALTRAGVLESVSGPKGGYALARPATEITLLDIVLAIEGDEPAFRCTEIRQRGPSADAPAVYRLPCPINAAMLRAEQAWRQSLRETTLAEITRTVAERATPTITERAIEWLGRNLRARSA